MKEPARGEERGSRGRRGAALLPTALLGAAGLAAELHLGARRWLRAEPLPWGRGKDFL